MIECSIAGRKCRLFGAERPMCLLVQPSARHENGTLEAEAAQLTALAAKPFLLVTIELEDWTTGLMPWWDGNISRDPEAGKHGQETLSFLVDDLLPELESRYGVLPVILGGYSLGGLFALWASCQTDRFRAVAAASPSVWIHGWMPFAKKHVPMAEAVYLSLGDREARTRNPVMARVADAIRKEDGRLQAQGIRHRLEWNPGNHFQDPLGRTAKGILWVLEETAQGKEV